MPKHLIRGSYTAEGVKGLLKEVDDKPDPDRIRHLMTSKVADALILELAGVDQSADLVALRIARAEVKRQIPVLDPAAGAVGPHLIFRAWQLEWQKPGGLVVPEHELGERVAAAIAGAVEQDDG